MTEVEVEPQRVIHRLLGLLGEATLEAAKYGALCDQLTEQVATLETASHDRKLDENGAS